ncbi:MAG: NAD(P)/FAD-dependent oxidoreductase [Gammaproteobacteria bacterium]|nr:NAD(P)/FAD-dependent oxidoreductase [Gammaproteobacteria bacterium]
MPKKRAVIIGAGPAGLTAAYELLEQTDVEPLVYEKTRVIGGISQTANYKGNRIDIGGHRFFSKSDRVMSWWTDLMPVEAGGDEEGSEAQVHYQGKSREVQLDASGPDPEKTRLVFLIRNRLSRIFYLRRFFDYPLSLSLQTIRNLGLPRMARIGFSYLRSTLLPIKEERTLEDFFINRFGRELYGTFFKDYTEKVWGVPCKEIGADWGAQRIKGLSITRVLLHALKEIAGTRSAQVSQKGTDTSLIERFLYPKYGPGQLWEEVAVRVADRGGEINMGWEARSLQVEGNRVVSAEFVHLESGATQQVEADYFFSTMPVKELIAGMGSQVPEKVREIAGGLQYRDFITVGLLLSRLKVKNEGKVQSTSVRGNLPDNWIYIQERDVKVGRVQVFNNWSPYMVRDPDTVWIGLEYFCNEGDQLWSMVDDELIKFATKEMEKIGFIDTDDLLDATVIRMPKAYPGYFGEAYENFDSIRTFTDSIENLFLIGRNGMHRYNNQDHSMLTAMAAVENIAKGVKTKEGIWDVNTESEYHEKR